MIVRNTLTCGNLCFSTGQAGQGLLIIEANQQLARKYLVVGLDPDFRNASRHPGHNSHIRGARLDPAGSGRVPFARWRIGSGRRTLLLDGDLRNSRCHEQLGVNVGPGLSEVLRGEAELAGALQTIPASEARVLTAGQSDPRVIMALSNGEFAALLTRLRQEFDCIIIDSAPTLVVADGLHIGKLVDGVILVVRPKVSKAPAVYSAYEQLTGLHIRTLGAVVNANPTKATSSYYARY